MSVATRAAATRLAMRNQRADHVQVTPYKPPRHQLTLVAKPGGAALGIAHAGEILAAVRLTPDEVLAHAERTAKAAVLAGVPAREVAERLLAALGVDGPPARRVATQRVGCCQRCGATFEPPHTRGKVPAVCPSCRDQARTRPPVTCRDCGATFEPRHRMGPLPRRCSACTAEAARKRARAYALRLRGLTP